MAQPTEHSRQPTWQHLLNSASGSMGTLYCTTCKWFGRHASPCWVWVSVALTGSPFLSGTATLHTGRIPRLPKLPLGYTWRQITPYAISQTILLIVAVVWIQCPYPHVTAWSQAAGHYLFSSTNLYINTPCIIHKPPKWTDRYTQTKITW